MSGTCLNIACDGPQGGGQDAWSQADIESTNARAHNTAIKALQICLPNHRFRIIGYFVRATLGLKTTNLAHVRKRAIKLNTLLWI
jgi:hypothetical protein